MTTALRIEIPTDVSAMFPDLIPARPDGILARVRRPCGEHDCECGCVGHLEDEGCLVFWCSEGEHPVTFRSSPRAPGRRGRPNAVPGGVTLP